MFSIKRYIILLFIFMYNISAFSQSKERAEVIYIPYADTISQELLDYIDTRIEPYILAYHPKMVHLIPEMKCRRTFVPGKRIGVFSVAKDKQVSFSQGNLQYNRQFDKWYFADNQYDYIGEDNVKDGQLANHIDLFGWSGDSGKAPYGISASTTAADYVGNFVDWGINIIQGDAVNTWRTLSIEEWEYLIFTRRNASVLHGIAQVNGVNGLIILPDEWVCPQDISFKPGVSEYYGGEYYAKHQSFTKDQWILLEQSGAVFLPAIGCRYGDMPINIQHNSNYWTMSDDLGDKAYSVYFNTTIIRTDCDSRFHGHAVRLVHDTIVPPPAPCETFEINGVKFNMMCVEGGTFTMGTNTNAHQVTLSDYYIGETEVTCGLWMAVMGSLPQLQPIYPDDYPIAYITLADCRQFVERLSELTGRHFRLPTEAEWEYAARGGNKSKGYKYSGSDDINEVALWEGNNQLDSTGKKIYRPEPVKRRLPNELGTYDMTGNLCEWVSDWYAPYNLYPQINPTGAATHATVGRPCIYRGGCWTYTEKQSENTYRHSFTNRAANGIGLRLVMSDEEPFRAVYLNDTTRFYLRPVKKGTFMMGSREDDPIIQQNLPAKADELPQHKVILDSDYWVAEYELTQAIWTTVMGTDIYDLQAALTKPVNGDVPAGPDYPMYFVYTKDVFEFTRRLSKMTGLNFRLPTEAEWEFAARGGNLSHDYLYAGSNNPDSVAWYSKSTASGVQRVGQKMPNELGIYDMSGNVLERCVDYLEYHQPYDPNDSINPRGKVKNSGNRAYRGGAHNMHKDSVRVTHRAPQTPTFTSQNVGTRVVVNDEHHFQTFNVGSVWFDMIFVEGGTFMMGALDDDNQATPDERPHHSVTLSDFYMGQTEVTQALWKAVMGTNPSVNKASGNHPVENVSWNDCQKFLSKLNQLTGLSFRLPTEAEWEYAANGGQRTLGYKYAGSNNINDVAWYEGNTSESQPVAQKHPNELGLYDMTGNIYELCYDWYAPYSVEPQTNPQGASSSPYGSRVVRGGCWYKQSGYSYEHCCRIVNRGYTSPDSKNNYKGLRLVLDTVEYIPVPTEPAKRIGVFSVAKDKQVSFSQGNLQYNRQLDKWYFANNQYDYIGENNIKDNQLANRIDLFGWSGDSGKALYGISASTTAADYAGNFVDWGTNIIQDDATNTWRTLSIEEWEYLIFTRRNASALHGIAQVNGVNGLIILPDEWACPQDISFKPGVSEYYGGEYYAKHQSFTKDQWILLEQSGAVFLPAIGCRYGDMPINIQHNSNYWTMSDDLGDKAYSVYFNTTIIRTDCDSRFHGHAVRPVRPKL